MSVEKTVSNNEEKLDLPNLSDEGLSKPELKRQSRENNLLDDNYDAINALIDNMDSGYDETDKMKKFKEKHADDLEDKENLIYEIKEDVKAIKQRKKGAPKKADIVEDIKKLALIQQHVLPYTERELSRMKKARLQAMLGNMLNDAVDNVNSPPELRKAPKYETEDDDSDEMMDDESQEFNYEEPAPSARIPSMFAEDVGAKQLYMLNIMMGKVLEHGTNQVLSKNKRLNNYEIDGFSDNLQENREQLLECYAQIYKQYGQSLGQYLTPVNMVILINSQAFLGSVKAKSEKSNTQ